MRRRSLYLEAHISILGFTSPLLAQSSYRGGTLARTRKDKKGRNMTPAVTHSSTWFRSKDLGVMSPARYTSCAMLLKVSSIPNVYSQNHLTPNTLTQEARRGAPRRVVVNTSMQTSTRLALRRTLRQTPSALASTRCAPRTFSWRWPARGYVDEAPKKSEPEVKETVEDKARIMWEDKYKNKSAVGVCWFP